MAEAGVDVAPGAAAASPEAAVAPPPATFTRALLRDHAAWADDATTGASPPRGWQGLARALFAGLEVGMEDAPGCRVVVTAVERSEGQLLVRVHGDADEPPPPRVLRALHAMVAEARRVSSETCPRCGRDLGPGGAVDGRLAAHAAAAPACSPSPTMRAILAAIDRRSTEAGPGPERA